MRSTLACRTSLLVAFFWAALVAAESSSSSGHASIAVSSLSSSEVPTFWHDVCLTDAQCLNGGSCHVVPHSSAKAASSKSSSSSSSSTLQKQQQQYNYCTCHGGYGGQRCESYCPLKCQNGGVCHAKSSSSTSSSFHNSGSASISSNKFDPIHPLSATYACKCLGLWTGTICDVPYENCIDGSQCYNGGTCRVRNRKNATISAVSYCDDCPAGFGGASCQEKVRGSMTAPKSKHGLVLNETLVTYLSLGIVLLATGIASTLFIVLRRRSNGVSYKTVQATEDVEHDDTGSSSDDLPKQEKWRNVV